jgi:hypothetical protein
MNRTQSESIGPVPARQLRSRSNLESLRTIRARPAGITTIFGASSIDAIRGTAVERELGRPNTDPVVADSRKRCRSLSAEVSTTSRGLRLRSRLSPTTPRLLQHFGSWSKGSRFQNHINFLRVVEAFDADEEGQRRQEVTLKRGTEDGVEVLVHGVIVGDAAHDQMGALAGVVAGH